MNQTQHAAEVCASPTVRRSRNAVSLSLLAGLCVAGAALAGGPPPPSVYPSAAHVGGGSTVVIFGTDIGTDIANTTVSIGGVPATIVANAQHDIEVTVPPRARSGAVNVVVNKLGGPILVSDAFLYRHDHQAGRDFAHTSNPNGPWQIGWAASRTSAFNLITQPPVRSGGGTGCLHVWLRNGNDVPAVGRNRNSTPCSGESTWVWPAGAIGGHPANDGSNAVIRFVAPATTAYHVYGDFTGSDPQPTTSDGAVLHNGTEVFSANVGYNVPQAFDLHLDLNAGDTLDFTIGHGGNGYAYDQTAMQIHIVGDLLHDDGFE
ncbi:MAG: IPT/TIG domain-containing protein [Xanthomonadales bacterium]|nr:IPT/TIG domain-containing protein [Xanthomonadales bacterium]